MVVTIIQKNVKPIQTQRSAGTSSDTVLNRLDFDVRAGCGDGASASRKTSAQVTTANAAIQTQNPRSLAKKGKKNATLPLSAIAANRSARHDPETRGDLRASNVKMNTTLLKRPSTKTSRPAKWKASKPAGYLPAHPPTMPATK